LPRSRVSTAEHEDFETVYQSIYLENAIDGLESFASKLRYAKSQVFEKDKNSLLTGSSERVPLTGICTRVGTDMKDSDADSSLGILQEDDMPG
jgi:hypothetical protein